MIISGLQHSGDTPKTNIIGLADRILDAIFNNSISAIELYDEKGVLLDINQASLNLFGITQKSEILSFNFFDDPNITPERNEDLLNGDIVKYETIINFDEVKKKNLFKTHRNGSIRIKVTVIPIFDDNKEMVRILFIGDEEKEMNIEES